MTVEMCARADVRTLASLSAHRLKKGGHVRDSLHKEPLNHTSTSVNHERPPRGEPEHHVQHTWQHAPQSVGVEWPRAVVPVGNQTRARARVYGCAWWWWWSGGGTCAVTKMSTATPAGRAHQLQSTHRAKSHFPWCGIQRGALTLYYTGDARETSEESKASDEGGESEESTEISEPRAGSGESTEISETEGQTCLRRIPFPHRERQGVVIRTTACQNNP
jgi:hypothetical protein